MQKEPVQSLRLGANLVDIEAHTIHRNGADHRIDPRLMSLLLRLHKRSNRVIKREELLTDVWAEEEGSDEALTQAISRLRRLLGDKNMIQTIPKVGYRLVTKDIERGAPDSEKQLLRKLSISKLSQTALLWGAMGILFLLVVYSIVRTQGTEYKEVEIILSE